MSTPKQNTVYDIIIVGGGPAGLTAGLYACRGGMDTLLLEQVGAGGEIATAELVENYPGFPEGINGYELAEKMKLQAEKFGLDIRIEKVRKITEEKGKKVVETRKQEYRTLSVVIAVGSNPMKLGIPGEEELRGKGVSYCATCDGPFFRDKEIAVVGGGNTAVQEALFLSKFAARVHLIHRRSRLRAAKILQERLFHDEKIKFVKDSIVTRIGGEGKVETVFVKNVKTGLASELSLGGIFIAVGYEPNTGFLKGTVELDEYAYILTDEDMKTSAEGIYACGDVRKKKLRQVVTACGEGAAAAFSARNYVEELKGTAYGENFSV